MKTSLVFGLALVLLTFVLVFASVSNFRQNPSPPNHKFSSLTVTAIQPSSPQQNEVDRSEIGSTNGIVVMGFVIVAIILFPIIAYLRSATRAQNRS